MLCGVRSIIMAGGYSTDSETPSEDGSIWYTGAGGNDNLGNKVLRHPATENAPSVSNRRASQAQIADQSLQHKQNAALHSNISANRPIRVFKAKAQGPGGICDPHPWGECRWP